MAAGRVAKPPFDKAQDRQAGGGRGQKLDGWEASRLVGSQWRVNVSLIDTTRTLEREIFLEDSKWLQIGLTRARRIC